MHGKGGSMHCLTPPAASFGAYAIIGAAAGHRQRLGLVGPVPRHRAGHVCFLGDGATNIGAFHEAVNLAAVWQCRVFICENQPVHGSTPDRLGDAVARPAADRALPTGSTRWWWTATTLEAVYEVAQAALGRARDGGGPALIEALTYRTGGHSRADPGKDTGPTPR